MQDELEKMYSDGSLPNCSLTRARFRSYTTLHAKRLGALLGSAQDGLKSALEIQHFAGVEKSDLSKWEKEKVANGTRAKGLDRSNQFSDHTDGKGA